MEELGGGEDRRRGDKERRRDREWRRQLEETRRGEEERNQERKNNQIIKTEEYFSKQTHRLLVPVQVLVLVSVLILVRRSPENSPETGEEERSCTDWRSPLQKKKKKTHECSVWWVAAPCGGGVRCLPESVGGQRAHSIPQPSPYRQQQSMKVT